MIQDWSLRQDGSVMKKLRSQSPNTLVQTTLPTAFFDRVSVLFEIPQPVSKKSNCIAVSPLPEVVLFLRTHIRIIFRCLAGWRLGGLFGCRTHLPETRKSGKRLSAQSSFAAS